MSIAVVDVVVGVGLVLVTTDRSIRFWSSRQLFRSLSADDLYPHVWGVECLSEQLTLEERHRLLKEALQEIMEKKRFIEMNIGQQFEELKKVEISLEKMRASRDERLCGS